MRGKKATCFSGHDKLTPSLSFETSKNIWKCFGCGQGGDVISLVMAALGCDFKVALEWFAREFSVDVSKYGAKNHRISKGTVKKRPLSVQKQLSGNSCKKREFSADPEVYEWLISNCQSVTAVLGQEYLKNHGIPPEVADRFSIRELRYPSRAFSRMVERWGAERVYRCGLAWGEGGVPERLIWTSYSILFPFKQNDKVYYIQGRLFKGNAKYLSLRGGHPPLYNIERLDSVPLGSTIHICEGIPDAIALESLGLPAVAVLGASSFRAEWVDLFMRYDIVLLPDGDSGGETFFKTISKYFAERGKAIRKINVPIGKDVSDIIAKMR